MQEPIHIPIRFLSPSAKAPLRARPCDAGYDVFSTEDYWLRPGERHLFKLGISLSIPCGYVGLIRPRSGLALKSGIDVMAGTVDSGYLDDIGVLLINLSDGEEENSVQIKVGDRIAQIVFQKCESVMFQAVESFSGNMDRGGGFGSTGS